MKTDNRCLICSDDRRYASWRVSAGADEAVDLYPSAVADTFGNVGALRGKWRQPFGPNSHSEANVKDGDQRSGELATP
ncbi:hypothetical protein NLI96_g1492 [Meripilus lineatus]|uniref:Uncharacterized protein n=1 Tax=Meripilus lineatus TaxID=2056292 RepID=A0AAD5YIE1_9APHY|nr:hypothetical protein NLI96_g1492 [Physisporinus lineatus]